MNKNSEHTKETCVVTGQGKDTGYFANKIEKIKQKDYTCPLCREVIKGIAEFGRHLKGHCT
ncbi:hypothetical protein H8E50_02730 [bacterium]|nr:hypothetical protein [bacterium]